MIDTLIFDFGDVFINLDKEAPLLALQKLGLNQFTPEMILMNEHYETGQISTQTLLEFYQAQFPEAQKETLIEAWNSIILDFPQNRLDFITQLKQNDTYTLVLLSNTNALHIDKVKESMGLKQYEQFKNSFDAFYLSHEIGLRKPTRQIFEFVLSRHQTQPETCFFVDDTVEHIKTAQSMGFTTWNINPQTEDITDLFQYVR